MQDGTFIKQLLWPSYFLFRRQLKSVGEFAPDKSGKPEIVPTRGPEVGWEDQLIRMRLLASMKEMMVERMDESGREAMTNVQNCLVGTFLRGTPMYITEGPREEKERDVSTLQTVLWKHCTFKLSIRDPSLSPPPPPAIKWVWRGKETAGGWAVHSLFPSPVLISSPASSSLTRNAT